MVSNWTGKMASEWSVDLPNLKKNRAYTVEQTHSRMTCPPRKEQQYVTAAEAPWPTECDRDSRTTSSETRTSDPCKIARQS